MPAKIKKALTSMKTSFTNNAASLSETPKIKRANFRSEDLSIDSVCVFEIYLQVVQRLRDYRCIDLPL
ncbi:hypothetical protein DPMN_112089 [Dreissena polymorpha]|uniref:Uncharacterized protein n=1 Tax=Dreissena polymorpha TaxID=45954 RepID=A0A9D4QPL5_DREPO|nr:hypothetical protein DPMN_112089 [Dreissena polymorpha]